jgi:hypothetical protein
MFPRKFANNATYGSDYHRAICIAPRVGQTNEFFIEKLRNGGIATYCEPYKYDEYGCPEVDENNPDSPEELMIVKNASCCAFTKDTRFFYLFPVHKSELASTGLVEEDLLQWLTKFNSLKVGFNFVYFGEQLAPECTHAMKNLDWRVNQNPESKKDNTFYWVGVPVFEDKANINKPYLHWVVLRYLWNCKISGHGMKSALDEDNVQYLAYYNIPRVTMLLHEEYNLPFLKSFLFAHAAHSWCRSNSMCHSNIMGITTKDGHGKDVDYHALGYQAPNITMKRVQFKALWDHNANFTLNNMLTPLGLVNMIKAGATMKDFEGLRSNEAPYAKKDTLIAIRKLFNEGDYQGFIDAIKKSYRTKKTANEKVSA